MSDGTSPVRRWPTVRRLARFLAPYKGRLLLQVSASLAISGAALLPPIVTRALVDRVLAPTAGAPGAGAARHSSSQLGGRSGPRVGRGLAGRAGHGRPAEPALWPPRATLAGLLRSAGRRRPHVPHHERRVDAAGFPDPGPAVPARQRSDHDRHSRRHAFDELAGDARDPGPGPAAVGLGGGVLASPQRPLPSVGPRERTLLGPVERVALGHPRCQGVR